MRLDSFGPPIGLSNVQFLESLIDSLALSAVLSTCLPIFLAALSTSLPSRPADPSEGWQATTATENAATKT